MAVRKHPIAHRPLPMGSLRSFAAVHVFALFAVLFLTRSPPPRRGFSSNPPFRQLPLFPFLLKIR